MPSLVVGNVQIPVSTPGINRDRDDLTDRGRAFDGSYRASATGTAKREWHFTTIPVTRSVADVYEQALTLVTPQTCSGDVIGGSANLVLQSENFGVTWGVDNTPTRAAADITVGGIVLDALGDDNAAAVEGYKQTITFTGNANKAASIFTRQVTSVSSGIRIIDNTAATNRLWAILTWSAGLPVLTMSTGTFLGYDVIGSGVFRLLFQTTSVTAANSNELNIFPATTAGLAISDTGVVDFGGVQVENATAPTSYTKTTTAGVSTLSTSCCAQLLGQSFAKGGSGQLVVLEFSLAEV